MSPPRRSAQNEKSSEQIIALVLAYVSPPAWPSVLPSPSAQEKAATMNVPPKVLVINREILKPGKRWRRAPENRERLPARHGRRERHRNTISAWMHSVVPAARSFSPVTIPSPTGKKKPCPNRKTPRFPPRSIARPSPMVICCKLTRPACTFCATTIASTQSTDLAHDRYLEIGVYHVKPGHEEDWVAIMKLVKDASAQVPDLSMGDVRTRLRRPSELLHLHHSS